MPKDGKREDAGSKPRTGVNAKNRSIKFTDPEWEAVKKQAESAGMNTSEYIRRLALKGVKP